MVENKFVHFININSSFYHNQNQYIIAGYFLKLQWLRINESLLDASFYSIRYFGEA